MLHDFARVVMHEFIGAQPLMGNVRANPVIVMLSFVLHPKHFRKLATEHAIYLNEQDAKRHQDQPDSKEISTKETAYIRGALGKSFLLVIGAVTFGWLTGYFGSIACGPTSTVTNHLLQFGGVGMLLWATLGKQGWNIQTVGGRSLIELVDQWIYRALYLVGSYLLVLSVSWPTE
jgi:hypothetical protein